MFAYFNFSVIAMAWAGVATEKPAAYGALAAAFTAVLSARSVYVPRLLSWMPVLQNWEMLLQRAAGEFLAFLLRMALRGQALQDCVDSGNASAPYRPLRIQEG